MAKRNAVGILLPDVCGGGAERVMVELAHQFGRLGYPCAFLLMRRRGELLREAEALGPVYDLRATRVRDVAARLPAALRQADVAVLIANMWPLTTTAAMALRRPGVTRPRLALVEHNPLSRQYAGRGSVHRAALRVSLAVGCRLADICVAVSAGVAHDTAALAGMDPSRFNVVPNPIAVRPEPSAAALAEAEALWGARPGRRLLTVGSLKAQKNQMLAIEAFAAMTRQRGDRLMLLGEGPLRETLRARAEALRLGSAVLMPGFRIDPTPFYHTADLFLLSSNYEGFGNVIVEALAAGLPVVSTDCPSGPREILDGGRFGRLTPIGDARALALALTEVAAARVDRHTLRARAADFKPERIAEAYLKLLFPSGVACPRKEGGARGIGSC